MPRTVLVLTAVAAVAAAAPAQTRPAQTQSAARVVWPDEGPRTWTPRPTVGEITANDLRTRLYQFADDSMSGRRIGEPGNYKGTEYIAREFARLGLKPAGDGGTYFQVLDYGPIGIDSNTARLAIAGTPLTRRTEWIPMLPSAANGMSAKVDIASAQAVYAGRVGDTSVALGERDDFSTCGS